VTSRHPFIRPGQVTPGRPAPDICMQCGAPEAAHAAGPYETGAQARAVVVAVAAFAAVASYSHIYDL
jgi:hypothetical protein